LLWHSPPVLAEYYHPPRFSSKTTLDGSARDRHKQRIRSGLAQSCPAPTPQADLFAQVTQVLHTISVGRNLLLAIDDLQWADDGTAALLLPLGQRLAGGCILLVCACCPEARAHGWSRGGIRRMGRAAGRPGPTEASAQAQDGQACPREAKAAVDRGLAQAAQAVFAVSPRLRCGARHPVAGSGPGVRLGWPGRGGCTRACALPGWTESIWWLHDPRRSCTCARGSGYHSDNLPSMMRRKVSKV
jgi:hypothetical protein